MANFKAFQRFYIPHTLAYSYFTLLICCTLFLPIFSCYAYSKNEELILYYWNENKEENFGDLLSKHLVEHIIHAPITCSPKILLPNRKKLLAIGSVFFFARDHDVIWGSGINGKTLKKSDYRFSRLDVRAVRGPLSRAFLMEHFQIKCPEVYGDPALLMPYFFPEFKKSKNPTRDYIVIPHFSEEKLFPKAGNPHIVHPTEPWDQVIKKILDSKFVISSSLHGIIVAEAYGIPARMLRVTQNEHIFKFNDYYLGTNRPHYQYATSVEEALKMGGEEPFECDLEKLYLAFPFDYWPNHEFHFPHFNQGPPCLQ